MNERNFLFALSKRYATDNGMTFKDFCYKAGISEKCFYNKQTAGMNVVTIWQVCNAMGLKLSEFFKMLEEEENENG